MGFDFAGIIRYATVRTLATMALNPFEKFKSENRMEKILEGVVSTFAMAVSQNATLTCLKIAEKLKRSLNYNVLTLEGLER